jgi:hypothetical protein
MVQTATFPADFTPQTDMPINLGLHPEGSSDGLQGSRFEGRMDEVTLFNRALSPAEMQALFNAGSAGMCPPQTNCLTIQCPTNINVPCQSTNGTPVFYTVAATNHCAEHEVGVICEPPSGSLFPIGATTVNCWAIGSGQTNQCSFTVDVEPMLRVRNTITVEWDSGVLQASDHVAGPYTDVSGATSPFATDVEAGRRFFRVRDP